MKWITILFLVAGGISVFIYVLALFRWFQIKWYFQNTLPYSEQECIKVFPRYPLWYYKMRSTPWNDRIAKDLVKRNQILMEYDKAKAEQLVHAEKQMFCSWSVGGVATAIFAFAYVMTNHFMIVIVPFFVVLQLDMVYRG